MDIFANVTKRDILSCIYNQGRKVKRKTCNSNGTRYVMNRLLRSNINATNHKGTDHSVKDRPYRPSKVLLYQRGGWVVLELTKKQINRIKKKCIKKPVYTGEFLTLDTRGYK